MRTVKLGTKVRFNPFEGVCITGLTPEKVEYVTGTVIELHRDRKWFAVEYELNGVRQRTSFHFADIGDIVDIYH